MSRPTSKKESKELLKFFNSLKSEKELDNELEIITIVFYIYAFSIIYILYNMFSVFF
jgi:hypothetical protein